MHQLVSLFFIRVPPLGGGKPALDPHGSSSAALARAYRPVCAFKFETFLSKPPSAVFAPDWTSNTSAIRSNSVYSALIKFSVGSQKIMHNYFTRLHYQNTNTLCNQQNSTRKSSLLTRPRTKRIQPHIAFKLKQPEPNSIEYTNNC